MAIQVINKQFSSRHLIIRLCQLILSVGTLAFICYLSLRVTAEVWAHNSDPDWLLTYVSSVEPQWLLVTLGCFIVLMIMGFPRQAVSFFCGVGFGAFQGTIIALLLTGLSACIAYLLASGPLRMLVMKVFGHKLTSIQDALARRSFRNILFIRLFPIGSNLVTNALAGVLKVPFLPFISASLLGFLPQTLLFSLLGSGSTFINTFEQPMQIASLVVSVFLLLSLTVFSRKSSTTQC